MLNEPPPRRGPSAWSLRPFTPWLGVHSWSLGPQCGGKLRHHLPRNSRNSSTLLVSAAAALASCLGEGTSHSLSVGHRTGEKMTWLGNGSRGRLHPWNSGTKASFKGQLDRTHTGILRCSSGQRFNSGNQFSHPPEGPPSVQTLCRADRHCL